MRRLILATALALLCASPAARAATIANMTPAGLSVVAQEADHNEDIRIIGRLTPEDVIGSWTAESTGCISVGFTCVHTDNHVDCSDAGVFSARTECERRSPGVSVSLKGGDDNLDVYRGKSDPFTIDMGAGDDNVNTDGFEINVGEPPGGFDGPWTANLGTGNDTYLGSVGPDFVQGGDGGDVIDPGPGADGVSAGTGNDVVKAGAETERADADSYDGGSGIDTLDYRGRTTPIFAAAIGTTGGASGEGDSISGFERILGGSGGDSILGFSSNGGPGNDVLTGSNGDDTITGGTGADTLRGFGGNDTIDANDGVADTRIDCSTGKDTVFLDLKDPNPDDAENCELIDRRKVDEEPGTQILTASARVHSGGVALRLHCPRHAGCAGKLSLTGGVRGSERYHVRPGATETVRVAVRGAGRTAVATATEKGRKGAETVIRRVKLR
jgi:Ca2+-binding RTX toxin-like protein